VFRHCGKVLRLVVTENKRQPFFSSKRKFDKAIAGMIADRRVSVPEPYSSTVMAVAVAAVPQALADLSRVRQSVRCDHCQCVLKDGGPVDEGSAQETFIIDQLNSSQVAKRNMRHDH
jgi:hypothetical protein